MTHRINVASSRGSAVHATDPDPEWSLPALGQFTYSETLCGRTIPRHGAWTETRSPVTCAKCEAAAALEGDRRTMTVDGVPAEAVTFTPDGGAVVTPDPAVVAEVAESTAIELEQGIVTVADDDGAILAVSTGLRLTGDEVHDIATGELVARVLPLPRPDAVDLTTPDGETIGMPASDRASVLLMTYEWRRDRQTSPAEDPTAELRQLIAAAEAGPDDPESMPDDDLGEWWCNTALHLASAAKRLLAAPQAPVVDLCLGCGLVSPEHAPGCPVIEARRSDIPDPGATSRSRYVDSLPEGYRWATEEETERWEELPDLAYVRVSGNADARDLAVPDAPTEA